MNRSRFSGARSRVKQRRLERPWGIIIVACFQVLKAGALLFAGILLRWKPEMVDSSQSILYPLLYIATRGNYTALNAATQGGNLLPGLIFLLGLYLAVIGSGLWLLKKWARRTVMVTCAVTLFLGAKALLMSDAGISGINSASSDLQNLYILLFLDGVVFIYLIRSKTGEVFEARA